MNPRPVTKDDLFRFRFLTAAVVSPDGRQVVTVVTHVDADPADGEGKKKKEFSTLYRIDLDSDDVRPLTSGQFSDSGPQWSPDGRTLAFISARGKLHGADAKAQIHLLPMDGGEARPITTLKQGVGGPLAWSHDGRFIAFTAARAEEPPKPETPFRLTRHVYRFNEMEYIEPLINDVWLVEVATGALRRVTDAPTVKAMPHWSPDDARLLILEGGHTDSHNPFQRLLVVPVGESVAQPKRLAADHDVYKAGWLPNGLIVFMGSPTGAPNGDRVDLWLTDGDDAEPVSLSSAHPLGLGGGLEPDMPVFFLGDPTIVADHTGTHIYETLQRGGAMELVRFDVSGTSHVTLVDGPRSVFLVAVTDSQLVYGVSDAFTPPDLYLADLDGSNERRLTHLNEALLTELRRPTLEHLQFKGADGVDVEGWYLRPTADGAQAPYPTILKIHGGPHAGYGHIFSFDFHMLTGAGYGVLYINHRGSTGYGADFATKIIGDWGNHDYHDLMAGVDEAIARGLADPDRLGVSGLSGGGNLSCWIVGHTDRFKAAMPENPVTSWLSFYGVSDIGPWFAVRELGGHPHEIPEVYARCSPLTYAHQCRTPTLLVQADHDWRCPPEQSEQFYTALKVAGCTVEMLRLPLGGHASSIIGPLEMRLAHNDALLEWMGRYVMAPADH